MRKKKDFVDWMYFVVLIVICIALFVTVALEVIGK